MDDLTREGSLSPAMAEFLKAAVLGRMNILVSGGTGSGKTTTLNVIARFIPHNQRVITIEDAAELQIDHPHVIALEHRPPNVEGKGELTIRQLLRNSLRMRPDRILVGEVRGAEALDMLQAMNTGHDGSMSTIHSNSARDALSRLETMVMMASIDIPFEAVRAQIASAVNLIVHQARMPDGRRKVAQIAEVVGYDSNGAILRDIFLLGMGADLRLEYNATGYVPTSLDKAAFYGVQVDQDLFDPVKSRFVPGRVRQHDAGRQGPADERPARRRRERGPPGRRRAVQLGPAGRLEAAAADSHGAVDAVHARQHDGLDAGDAGGDAQADRRRAIGGRRPAGRGAAAAAAAGLPGGAAASGLRRSPAAPAAAPTSPALRPPRRSAADAVRGAAARSQQGPTRCLRAGPGRVERAGIAGPAGGDGDGARDHRARPDGGGRGWLHARRPAADDPRRGHGPRRRDPPHPGRDRKPHHPQGPEPAPGAGRDAGVRWRRAQGQRLRRPDHISKESAGRELRQAVEAGLLQVVRYPQGEAGFRASPGPPAVESPKDLASRSTRRSR